MKKKNPLYDFDVNIYALVNPIDQSIFYVGATCYTLNSRLKQHLISKPNGNNNIIDKRTQLIKNIISVGLKPEIFLLETVPLKDASSEEEFYYNLFTFYGFTLLQSKYGFFYSEGISTKIETEKYLEQFR